MISTVLYGQCVRLWHVGVQVLGVGTSLKVTIQHSSESRAFSTGSEEAAAAAGLGTDKYCCYICNVTSADQQVRLDPDTENLLWFF